MLTRVSLVKAISLLTGLSFWFTHAHASNTTKPDSRLIEAKQKNSDQQLEAYYKQKRRWIRGEDSINGANAGL